MRTGAPKDESTGGKRRSEVKLGLMVHSADAKRIRAPLEVRRHDMDYTITREERTNGNTE